MPQWEDGMEMLQGPRCNTHSHRRFNQRLVDAGKQCVGAGSADLHALLKEAELLPFAKGTTRSQLRRMVNSIRDHATSSTSRREALERKVRQELDLYLEALEGGAM